MMTLQLNRGKPDTLPLELATVKADLRISGTHLDSLITEQYIPAARDWAEGYTKRSLINRTMKWVIRRFPGPDQDYMLLLPGGFVSSVGDIVYVSNSQSYTLTGPDASPAGTDFQLSKGDTWTYLLPPQGGAWPAVDGDYIEPVTINYSAGWATPADIPADIRRALTAYVYAAMELDGLLTIRSGFDIDHPEKLLSAYRSHAA